MLMKYILKVFKKPILQNTFRRLLFSVFFLNFFATKSPVIPIVLLRDLIV